MRIATEEPGIEITVDLQSTTVSLPPRGGRSGWGIRFAVDPFNRECLLNGWDEIALTLRQEAQISRYESTRAGWLPVSR
jgi:3-isopropylmalate/(R)-2-methylmalate dehydratase small subunit